MTNEIHMNGWGAAYPYNDGTDSTKMSTTESNKNIPIVNSNAAAETSKQQTAPKVEDYTWKSIPKDVRDNARSDLRNALKEVKIAFDKHNSNFPYQYLAVDYSEVPNPENYSKKTVGKTSNIYDDFQDAVKTWKELQLNRLEVAEQRKIADIEQVIRSGFFNLYTMYGITQDEIQDLYYRLGGDISRVKEELDERIKTEADRTRNVVRKESEKTNSQIDEMSKTLDDVSSVVKETNEEAKEKESLREEIGIAWHNDDKAVEKKVRNFLTAKGYRFDKVGEKENFDNSMQTVIENLSLEELRELRDLLKQHINDDPYVKADEDKHKNVLPEIVSHSLIGKAVKGIKNLQE